MTAREDLGAQFARVTRRIRELEEPLLRKHGLTMWEYVVLLRLLAAPAHSQLDLAQAIRYDKTRLVRLLDGLQQRGLLTREPPPNDRRARVVELTAEGRSKLKAVRRDIHKLEDQLLTPVERETLERLLDRL